MSLHPTIQIRASRRSTRAAVIRAVGAGLPALQARLLDTDPSAAIVPPGLKALARDTFDGVHVACLRGRCVAELDVPLYRYAGRSLALTGCDAEVAVELVDATVEAYRDELVVPCAHALERTHGGPAVEGVIFTLCGTMEAFTRQAYVGLNAGFADVVSDGRKAAAWRLRPSGSAPPAA